ncbi:hypothetical protein AMJ97_CH02081 [Rhizobium sp. N1314]|nr:hypothetical protein AMK02_CH02082 [Rhizobium sp. N731]ANL15913.1 hypothetical protein AMJ97_CH02081 [Rhizobium sp. N1314]
MQKKRRQGTSWLLKDHCKTRNVILGLVPRICVGQIKCLKINVFLSNNRRGQMPGTRPSMTEETLSTNRARASALALLYATSPLVNSSAWRSNSRR